MRFRHLLAVVTLAFAGCGGSTDPEGTGDYRVRVFNGSPYTMTDIRVKTAVGQEFRVGSLAHGDMSSEYRVQEMHTNPVVSATINGQTLTSMPIEGFSGMNPVLAPGSYTVDIQTAGTPLRIDVSVHQPVEDRR